MNMPDFRDELHVFTDAERIGADRTESGSQIDILTYFDKSGELTCAKF